MAIDIPNVDEPVTAQPVNAALQRASEDAWAGFQRARQDLAEVMTDEELRGLGFNLDVLDEAP